MDAATLAVAKAYANKRLNWRGAWAATTVYAKNDLVTYNGGLYRAPTAFTSGASFNKANWVELVPQSGTYASPSQLPTGAVGPNTGPLLGFGALTKVGIVVGFGQAGNFDEAIAESPAVWWDPTKNQYGMVYTGYASGSINPKIGLSWSPDLFTWTRDAAAPILAGTGVGGDPDQGGATGPFIWLEGGTYYLFYIGVTDGSGYEAGTKTLCLATASAITGPWTRRGTMVGLGTPATVSAWRSSAVYHPNVVKVSGTYYLFFNASNGTAEQIGYATATSPLGPWTVHDSDCPIVAVGTAGAWDDTLVGDPSLYKVADQWVMAYYGKGSNGLAQDGVATTTEALFPLGWTKNAANPILGPAGSPDLQYDSKYAHKPFIFQTPSRHFHFYTAVKNNAGTWRRIGLAVSPGARGRSFHPIPEQAAARTATSATFASVAQSTAMVDSRDKTGLHFRILVRANPNNATGAVIRDKSIDTSASINLTGGNSFQNFESQWVHVENTPALLVTNLEWKSDGTTTISLGNAVYEFRWFSGSGTA